MKKTVLFIFAVLLLMSAVTKLPVYAENSKIVEATILADELKKLGLFQGTDNGYELERPATRTEAMVMLIRLMRSENAARATTFNHSFKDIPNWANNYIAYAYKKGLTSGVDKNTFGSNDPVNSAQYITFVLRALGYSESNSGFSWDNPFDLAASLGLIENGDYSFESEFLRADLVKISYNALNVKLNGQEVKLRDAISEEVAIDNQNGNNTVLNNPSGIAKPYPGALIVKGRVADFRFYEDNIDTPEAKKRFIEKYGIGGQATAEMIPSPWNTHGEELGLGVRVTLEGSTITEHVPSYDVITWTEEMFDMYYENPPVLTGKDGSTPPYHLSKNEFFEWVNVNDNMTYREFELSKGTPGRLGYYLGREVLRLDNGATFELIDWDYNPGTKYEIDAHITMPGTISPSFAVLLKTFSHYYFEKEDEANEFYSLVNQGDGSLG